MNTSVQELIETGDGQCGAWARFFLDCVKVHGIDTANAFVYVGWLSDPKRGVLVKNWIFIGTGKSGDSDYPFISIRNLNGEIVYSEAVSGLIIPGRDNPNTPAAFNNHQYVNLYGYKDPSYGSTPPQGDEDDRDWGFSGYFWMKDDFEVDEATFNIDIDGDGKMDKKVKTQVILFKKHEKNFAPVYYETY